MLLTSPALRFCRRFANSHITVPHVTAAKIWCAVLSIGMGFLAGYESGTGARGSSDARQRAAQYSTICR